MNWSLWCRQVLTIVRVELKRHILARRWLGVYLIALAPVGMLLLALVLRSQTRPTIANWSTVYALFFQTYWLRFAIFFSCMAVFSQMFRGEMMEKTLHFYLLTPVRREVIAVGKYLAGVVSMSLIFGLCTVATNILIFLPSPGFTAFFLEGNGVEHLARYVLAAVLACVAYGSIFLLLGLLSRIPIIPAVVLLGWESFYFILPEGLQKITVVHYLQSFLPVGIDLGPFAVIAGPTQAVFGVPVLLLAAAAFVWLAGRILRTTQINYSAD